MDTTVVKGTILGLCHPHGVLYRCHRVNPTFTLCLKAALRKSRMGTGCTVLLIVIEYSYKLGILIYGANKGWDEG